MIFCGIVWNLKMYWETIDAIKASFGGVIDFWLLENFIKLIAIERLRNCQKSQQRGINGHLKLQYKPIISLSGSGNPDSHANGTETLSISSECENIRAH